MTTLRILLFEDEALIVRDIENKLKRMGHDFAGYAISGEAAVELVRQNQPDLVLMDIGLRGEMDGITAAAQVRQDFDIPIIFLTAYTENETLQRAKTTEPYGYIVKPVDSRELSIAIELAAYKHAAEKDRQRQLQRLAAMRAIDQAILNQHDISQTLHIALEQIVHNLRVDAAAVLLLNPYSQTLSYAAQIGLHADLLNLNPQPLGLGHAGQAALTRQRIIVADPASAASDHPFASYLALPMLCKGQVRGVLEVFHARPFQPGDEWLDFLETLANQTAIAVDNASLFEEMVATNLNLIQAYDTTIAGWSKALEYRHIETAGHSQRVTDLTMKLAQALGIAKHELEQIRRGALLHDIGKMGIPDSILLKPGPLTPAERLIMQQHPVYAYEMLSTIPFLKSALDIPHYHHEKWDGTGYPRGLQGEQIPLAARMFAIVDVFDAMSSNRPYQAARPLAEVLSFVQQEKGRHFDPRVVEAFVPLIGARL
jgi:putative nucleotidyltransferase with HDIG domain